MTPDDTVARAAPPGSPRALALLFAPGEFRPALSALYALDAELTSSSRIAEHAVAHARLDWWQEELERLAIGRPLHPLTRALAHAPRDAVLLDARLAAAREELAARVADSEQDFERWLDARRGTIELSAALILRFRHPRPAAPRLGRALGILELLGAMRAEARAGRSQVATRGVRLAEIAAEPWPDSVWALREQLARRAAGALAEARVPLAAEGAAARPLLVQAALAQRELARLTRRRQEPAPPGTLQAFGSLVLAWRAARRAGPRAHDSP
jgi:15-cis-phytoene synthase